MSKVLYHLRAGRPALLDARLAQHLHARGRGHYLTTDVPAPPVAAVLIPEPPAEEPAKKRRGRPPKARTESTDVQEDRQDQEDALD